jgi:sugar/nucleoside kinase (ribokinase family)
MAELLHEGDVEIRVPAQSAARVHEAHPVIACWRELMWDLFAGQAATLNTRRGLGGSAAAVAAQLSALGAEARLVSAVGQDDDGESAREAL